MRLKARERFDKFRIIRRIAEGGFASVYEAADTIEGIRVALKIPHDHLVNSEAIEDFRREVRLTNRLDHPNILPIKNAVMIKKHLVIVYPLAKATLSDRMQRRMGIPFIVDFADQILDGLAHAHANRVIHCDIKPDNILIFPEGRIRLSDFGIAKIALRTMSASGRGTLGYIAPEQAFGKPLPASDVFSLGLILHQMVARELPAWPFRWPFPSHSRLRERLPQGAIEFLRRGLEMDPKARFRDARRMQDAFEKVRDDILAFDERRLRRRRRG